MLVRLFCYLVLLVFGISGQDQLPDGFLMGFATASYQVEGGWNADGKGLNVWDTFTHDRPEMIFDRSNGDVADDSYHLYQQDVAMLKSLGAQVYRFSLSWSRILPTGFVDQVNPAGINYYKNLIKELKSNGIEPMVTLFHWDLPQPLQDLGGLANPYVSNYYRDYADVAFKNFGDDVKWWITFNEPLQSCYSHYGLEGGAPAVNMPGVVDYLCTHTILLSHAKAYHLYNETYRSSQGGHVGITLDGGHCHPFSNSTQDIEAAETAYQFGIGWFANPIFSTEGDYPAVMRQRVDANSQAEGRPESRLPKFTRQEVEFVKGTADFFGVNHYTAELHAMARSPVGPNPSWERDRNTVLSLDPSWPETASDWLRVVPWAMREHLKWIKKTYNNPPMFVTENGFSDNGELEDLNRISYYNGELHELLKAVYEDGCNVLGYTAWSLMDNYEWLRGYSEKFGIYHVDYNSPNRTRTEKSSVVFFRDILSSRTLPPITSTPRIN